MREIKFRGYNGLEWLYTEMIRYVSEDDFWQMMNHETDEWDCVSFIGQYTGLKDKNGAEIYEGDILEYKNTFGKNERTELLLVSWSNTDGMWCMGYIRTDYAIRNSSVIGNIYEHPELLEVK